MESRRAPYQRAFIYFFRDKAVDIAGSEKSETLERATCINCRVAQSKMLNSDRWDLSDQSESIAVHKPHRGQCRSRKKDQLHVVVHTYSKT